MNQIMSLYEAISAKSGAATEAAKLRDFVLAQQLGYADRDHYVADPDKVTVPVSDLLDPAYIKSRAESGFKPGDVILEINRKSVKNAEDAVALSDGLKDDVLLRVWSRGGSRFVVLQKSDKVG